MYFIVAFFVLISASVSKATDPPIGGDVAYGYDGSATQPVATPNTTSIKTYISAVPTDSSLWKDNTTGTINKAITAIYPPTVAGTVTTAQVVAGRMYTGPLDIKTTFSGCTYRPVPTSTTGTIDATLPNLCECTALVYGDGTGGQNTPASGVSATAGSTVLVQAGFCNGGYYTKDIKYTTSAFTCTGTLQGTPASPGNDWKCTTGFVPVTTNTTIAPTTTKSSNSTQNDGQHLTALNYIPLITATASLFHLFA